MTGKHRHIFLCGFSGSGKSTVGAILASRLSLRFVDLDVQIEKAAGKSIITIFQMDGERQFRLLERRMISEFLNSQEPRSVLSLGGGALHSDQIIQNLKDGGILVYLSCAVIEIDRRLRRLNDRPMLAVSRSQSRTDRIERIKKLLNSRKGKYTQADIKISTTNRTPAQVVGLILKQLKQNYGFV